MLKCKEMPNFLLQVGDESPDVSISDLASVWEVTQSLLRRKDISAGHDISDGGIAVALAEMAFASNVGIKVVPHSESIPKLFCPDICLVPGEASERSEPGVQILMQAEEFALFASLY